MDLLHDARQAINDGDLGIWWSSYLWMPVVSTVLFVLPPGIAYWLVYPTSDNPQQPVRALNGAVLLTMLLGALFLAASLWFQAIEPNMRVAYACFVIGVLAWLGVAACLVMLMPAPRTVTNYRVRATRVLRGAMGFTAMLAALGVADTVARTCYLYSFMAAHPWAAIGPAGALGGLVWLVRYGATLFDDGKQGATDSVWRSLLSRLPVSLLAGLVAALVALLVFVLWSWIVLWVRWDGGEPVDWHVFGKAWTTAALATLTLLALCMAIVVGRFAGFLNLSTLQSFYAARLTRAYLGASNGNRFSTPATDRAARQRFSVAEPAPDDALSLNDYYDPRVLAPLHLINVTMNQTVDPAEQLVQRDRKGKPLCIGPGPRWCSRAMPSSFPPTPTYASRSTGNSAARNRSSLPAPPHVRSRWRRRVPSATGSRSLAPRSPRASGAPRRWARRCCSGWPICAWGSGGLQTWPKADRARCRRPCAARYRTATASGAGSDQVCSARIPCVRTGRALPRHTATLAVPVGRRAFREHRHLRTAAPRAPCRPDRRL
jgi:hypothetical protein